MRKAFVFYFKKNRINNCTINVFIVCVETTCQNDFLFPPMLLSNKLKNSFVSFATNVVILCLTLKQVIFAKKVFRKNTPSVLSVNLEVSKKNIIILEKVLKVVIFNWAVHNSFRFVGMISKLQILPRIETKTTRESISFGIVSWETLGKTYCTADPSQNSNKDISKGNFSWRSCLGDFK